MKSVQLSLEERVVAVDSELHGSISIRNLRKIESLVLQLRAGNEDILLEQSVEGFKKDNSRVKHIPFTIKIPFSVLPGSIQNTLGSVVIEVRVVAKTRTYLIQKLAARLHDAHFITVQNMAPSGLSKGQMHSIDLDSTNTGHTYPEKDDTYSIRTDHLETGAVKAECCGCCLSWFLGRKKQPVKESSPPPSTTIRQLSKGQRWGYKTAFNTFVFPEFCDFQDEENGNDHNQKHVMAI